MSEIDKVKVTQVDYVGRYYELCDARDEVNAKNAPLEAELAKVNARIEQDRKRAEEIAATIDANRGGAEHWLALKREIRFIASGLGRIPPRPAKE